VKILNTNHTSNDYFHQELTGHLAVLFGPGVGWCHLVTSVIAPGNKSPYIHCIPPRMCHGVISYFLSVIHSVSAVVVRFLALVKSDRHLKLTTHLCMDISCSV